MNAVHHFLRSNAGRSCPSNADPLRLFCRPDSILLRTALKMKYCSGRASEAIVFGIIAVLRIEYFRAGCFAAEQNVLSAQNIPNFHFRRFDRLFHGKGHRFGCTSAAFVGRRYRDRMRSRFQPGEPRAGTDFRQRQIRHSGVSAVYRPSIHADRQRVDHIVGASNARQSIFLSSIHRLAPDIAVDRKC